MIITQTAYRFLSREFSQHIWEESEQIYLLKFWYQ